MKKYFLAVFLISFAFFSLGLFLKVSAAQPSDIGLKEGDLISAIFSDDPDVYIINEHGYKRLFLNPEIFKFYAHLGGFTNVKLVTPEVRDVFPTVGLFRNCEKNDLKVYGFQSDNEDKGKLRWIDTPGDQAVKDDPDFFKKVFCINDKEFKWYPRGQELKSVKEVPQYHRIAIPAIPATPAIPASPSHPFAPTASISQPLVPSVTPKPASGSFTTTPIPISITQPAIPAIPATPAVPGQSVASSSTPSPTASTSASPTPTPTSISTVTIPKTPANLTVLDKTDAYITLSWSPSSSDSSPSSGGGNVLYRVSRTIPQVSGVQSFSQGTSPFVFHQDSNTYTFLDKYSIQLNTTYAYTVSATYSVNREDYSSESNSVTVTTLSLDQTPPTTPTNLTAVVRSSSQVDLSWSASSDNVAVAGYNVYRDDNPQSNYLAHIDATATPYSSQYSYSDTKASAGKTYGYFVRAHDRNGNYSSYVDSYNSRVTVTPTSTPTPLSDTVPPSIITDLSAVASSPSQINLSWSATTDNVGVTGYKIYRNGAIWWSIWDPTNRSYSDTGLNSNTSYNYYVSAFDAAGNESLLSAAVSTTTQSGTITCSGLNLTFKDNKTSYTKGELVTYTYTCTPGGTTSYVEIQVVKPGGTITTYNTTSGSISTNTMGFGTDNLEVGSYTLRACFSVGCSSLTASLVFTITAPITQSTFSRNLTLGSTGNDVKRLQALLVNEVSYPADLLTGYFGSITRDAVKKLQEKYGVKPAYGYFGQITRQALRALMSN